MNRVIKPLALSALTLALAACSQPEQYPVSQEELKTEEQKQAYALGSSVGRFVGRNLDQQEEAEVMLDRNMVIAGFVDAVKGEVKLNEEEAAVVTRYSTSFFLSLFSLHLYSLYNNNTTLLNKKS